MGLDFGTNKNHKWTVSHTGIETRTDGWTDKQKIQRRKQQGTRERDRKGQLNHLMEVCFSGNYVKRSGLSDCSSLCMTSVCLFVRSSFCMTSVCLSVCLYVCLSVCPSVWRLYVRQFVSLSVCLSARLYDVCLPVCMTSVRPSVCLFLCLTWIYYRRCGPASSPRRTWSRWRTLCGSSETRQSPVFPVRPTSEMSPKNVIYKIQIVLFSLDQREVLVINTYS